jgi:hypothetical protein
LLDDVEDVFYLTSDDLVSPPDGARDLVARRRERSAFYDTLHMPAVWEGQPQASGAARELGIPCVVNTKTGSKVLRTGDIVRVEGTSGQVQILKRAD